MEDFSLKSERVHTVIQLLKAYAMFTKDVDYVIVAPVFILNLPVRR